MKLERVFTKDFAGKNILDSLAWKSFDVCLKDHRSDNILYQLNGIEGPSSWSQQSIDIMASKYFRRADVPLKTIHSKKLPDNCEIDDKFPEWLLPSIPENNSINIAHNGETSVKQVFHRLAGAWTFWGKMSGLLDVDGESSEENCRIFYDEIVYMLYHQIGAPNSPQFFNTGVWWAYGVNHKSSGYYYTNNDGDVFESKDLYSRSQAHACFILGVEDNLLDENGIYDLLKKEAKIFKLGSGAGTNFSSLRAQGERLSGGGTSSGLLSFLKIFDRAAECIKSGGVVRRAAKMLVLDTDHPDILEYIEWKSKEEKKAKILIDAGYDADFNGEAYKTVSGQNGNNSISVSHDFMQALKENVNWDTWWRVDKEKHTDSQGNVDWESLKDHCTPARTYPAKTIWDKMIQSSWKCADPAVLFNGTMNDWNTLSSDGKINSTNPCAEYVSLNDTACNLSSINLLKFLNEETNLFNVDSYKHAIQLWQIILETTNHMAQLPTEAVAKNVWKYRSTGLGPANLGALLMVMGFPYDSEEGRVIGSSLMSIMTGYSYEISARMAEELGSFDAYSHNRNNMLKVIRNHRRAAYGLSDKLTAKDKQNIIKVVGDYEDLTINPIVLTNNNNFSSQTNNFISCARSCWDQALSTGGSFGYRNAQVTVCAPTGTIALIMGCDSTGIEPCYALVTYKTLAGGGMMKIVNNSVRKSLENLNSYTPDSINAICEFIQDNGHVGCSLIKSEHKDIFKCAASPLGDKEVISWESHIKMLASLQSFVSGGISKTINMPESSTCEDISKAWEMAYDLGCKGVSIYRDNCKSSAPLNLSDKLPTQKETTLLSEISNEEIYNELSNRKKDDKLNINDLIKVLDISDSEIIAQKKSWGLRKRPGDLLTGLRFRIKIGQAQGYVQIFVYPDGRICEFFLTFGNPGSSFNNMLECWSIAFSIALQRGESLKNICSKYMNVEFEPKGFTGRKDDLRRVSSPVDYIVRLMLMYFDDDGYIKDPNIFINMARLEGTEENDESAHVSEDETSNKDTEDPSISRPLCPKCGSLMMGGTHKCPSCTVCGHFGGCG